MGGEIFNKLEELKRSDREEKQKVNYKASKRKNKHTQGVNNLGPVSENAGSQSVLFT